MKRDKPFMHGLTPKQLKLAWYTIDPKCNLTKKQIAKELGVQEETLWRWAKKPEFKNYCDEMFLKYAQGEEAGIWETMTKRAKERDGFQDRQLFFRVTGKLKDVKEVSGKDGAPIKLLVED